MNRLHEFVSAAAIIGGQEPLVKSHMIVAECIVCDGEDFCVTKITTNTSIIHQMLLWCTIHLPHSIDIFDSVTKVVPLCSVY